MSRAVVLAGGSSHALTDGQDRHPRIEPVHGLRYDATRLPSVKQARWRGLLLAPALNDPVQRRPSELGMLLQEAIEAQQQLLGGIVAIAEHAHVRHVFVQHSSEEASEAGKPAQ